MITSKLARGDESGQKETETECGADILYLCGGTGVFGSESSDAIQAYGQGATFSQNREEAGILEGRPYSMD